jgi:hypothetical protein
MQGRRTWVAAAVLFISALGGCATGSETTSGAVPPATFAPGGVSNAAESSAPQPHRRAKILKAPSAFDCRNEGGSNDVFEKQCEAETESGD